MSIMQGQVKGSRFSKRIHLYFYPVFTQQALLANHYTAMLEHSSEVTQRGFPDGILNFTKWISHKRTKIKSQVRWFKLWNHKFKSKGCLEFIDSISTKLQKAYFNWVSTKMLFFNQLIYLTRDLLIIYSMIL